MNENTYTEVTEEGWGTRLGNSVKGIVLGLGLFFGAFVLLFWNEGNYIKTKRDLERAQDLCVEPPTDSIKASNNGKLIYLSGAAHCQGERKDSVFGITSSGFWLSREVAMYQWKESSHTEEKKSMGGKIEKRTTYTYSQEWSAKAIDSSQFKQSSQHHNPPMPIQSKKWHAPSIMLGAFCINTQLMNQMKGWQAMHIKKQDIDTSHFENYTLLEQGESFILQQKTRQEESGEREAHIGDLRIQFQEIPQGEVSILARQGDSKGMLEPFIGKEDTKLMRLEIGKVSKDRMFAHAHEENRLFVWLLRAAGIIAMFFGLSLCLKPLEVFADVVPILGTIVGFGTKLAAGMISIPLSLITIGIAWLFYRPLIGGSMIVIVLALFCWVWHKKSKKQKEKEV